MALATTETCRDTRRRDKLTSIVHKMHSPLAINICVARKIGCLKGMPPRSAPEKMG